MKKGENTLILFGLSLVSRLPLVPLRFLIPVFMDDVLETIITILLSKNAFQSVEIKV